jgi:hypothetical protein
MTETQLSAADRLILTRVKHAIRRARRLDMTKPPVTQRELRRAEESLDRMLRKHTWSLQRADGTYMTGTGPLPIPQEGDVLIDCMVYQDGCWQPTEPAEKSS